MVWACEDSEPLNEWGFPIRTAPDCLWYRGEAWCSRGVKCPYNHPKGPHPRDAEFEEGTLAERKCDDPREPIKFLFIDSEQVDHELPSSKNNTFFWPVNYRIAASGQKIYWNKKTKRVKVKATAESVGREALIKKMEFNEIEKRRQLLTTRWLEFEG